MNLVFWRFKNLILLSLFFAHVVNASALNSSETSNEKKNHVVSELNTTTLKSTSNFSSTPKVGAKSVQGSESRNRTLRTNWVPDAYCNVNWNGYDKGECGISFLNAVSSVLTGIQSSQCLWCSTGWSSCNMWDGTYDLDGDYTVGNYCYWTDYSFGGCPSAYEQVDWRWSIIGNSEQCCEKMYTYECCDVLDCTASSPAPTSTPPPPSPPPFRLPPFDISSIMNKMPSPPPFRLPTLNISSTYNTPSSTPTRAAGKIAGIVAGVVSSVLVCFIRLIYAYCWKKPNTEQADVVTTVVVHQPDAENGQTAASPEAAPKASEQEEKNKKSRTVPNVEKPSLSSVVVSTTAFDTKFCSACGHAISDAAFCAACGQKVQR